MRFLPHLGFYVFIYYFAFSCPLFAQENLSTLPAQIILEPHMVSIILNDEHRDGVDWEAIVSDFHSLVLKKDEDATDNKTKLSVGTVSDEDYSVLLDALDAVGQIKQSIKEPVTVVADMPTTIPFVGVEAKNAISIDAELTVTTNGGKKLKLSPEVMGKVGSTTIEIKANSTIVLGSIFYEHEVTKTHKFPLLGDLPIVGLVFRNKGKLMQKIETIIFLTPKGN